MRLIKGVNLCGVIIAVLAFVCCILGVLIYVNTPNVFCAEPVFNAGRISYNKNDAEYTHIYKIENNYDFDLVIKEINADCPCLEFNVPQIVKAKSFGNLEVKLIVSKLDIYFQKIFISVSFENTTDLLDLTFICAGEFKAFLNHERFDLGVCHIGEPVYKKVKVFIPHNTFVQQIVHETRAKILSGNCVTTYKRKPILFHKIDDKNGGKIFVSSQEIEFIIVSEKEGDFEKEVEIVLDNGKVLKIVFSGCGKRGGYFLPNKYFLSGGETLFSVNFVVDKNDPLKKFQVRGGSAQIVEERKLNRAYLITVKYVKNNNVTVDENLFLQAFLQSGKMIEMPIITGIH